MALTNKPFQEWMPAIALSGGWQEEETGKVNNTTFDPGGMGNPVSGYLDQDWNPVQLEINRRVQKMMAGNRLLGWQTAFQMAMAADPSLAGKNWDAINVELIRRTKQMMAGNNALNYGRALEAVLRDDPTFCLNYRAAKMSQLGTGVDLSTNDVDAEIMPLVKDKIAASDGKMAFMDGWRAVLSERPDLGRRRKAAM